MKHRYFLVITSFVALTALLLGALGVSQTAADSGPAITGSWFGTATATTAPLPPLKDLITFMSDGNVIDGRRMLVKDSPLGPLLATPGHGVWAKTGANEFAATLVLVYEGAEDHPTTSGQVLATEKVRLKLSVGPDRDTLSGSLLVEVRDTNGNIVFVGPGTFEAKRVALEPLP